MPDSTPTPPDATAAALQERTQQLDDRIDELTAIARAVIETGVTGQPGFTCLHFADMPAAVRELARQRDDAHEQYASLQRDWNAHELAAHPDCRADESEPGPLPADFVGDVIFREHGPNRLIELDWTRHGRGTVLTSPSLLESIVDELNEHRTEHPGSAGDGARPYTDEELARTPSARRDAFLERSLADMPGVADRPALNAEQTRNRS